MKLISTGNPPSMADFRTALFQGIAPDGGLYVPARLTPLAPPALDNLRGGSLADTAFLLSRHLLGDEIPDGPLSRLVSEALTFPIPLKPLDAQSFVLELFHGPTLAFKDVGARFMAGLMRYFHSPERGTLTVITATSGDTGGAVAHAFHLMAGVRVIVLFPHGLVSDMQRRQFTTLSGNVEAVAVEGTFDDCQRLAKGVLRDPNLRRAAILTSANSINIGRLLPQIFYYFHAWAQLPEHAEPVFSVPSGNVGNLVAGLMAKRLGLPVRRFVAASNANDVLSEFLATGQASPRVARHTISSAMDVGNPNNLPRVTALYADDVTSLRADVATSVHTDENTRRAIKRVMERHGYLLDPHSAVGYLALVQDLPRDPRATGVLLATAHPAKFAGVVEPVIGRAVRLPPQLAGLAEREEHVIRIPAQLEALRPLVLRG